MLLNELVELGYPLTVGNTQYTHHYTDGNALLSILENTQFWASNGFFMNDSNEFTYMDRIMQEVIHRIHDSEHNLTTLISQILNDEYDRWIKKEIYNPHKSDKFFVVSFSDNPDSQVLWANYTQNQGYNLTIDKLELANSLSTLRASEHISNYFLGEVIYDKEKQIETLCTHFSKVGVFLEGYLKTCSMTNETMEELIAHMHVFLETMSLFFKDPSFSQEQEFRMVVRASSDANRKCIRHRVSKNMILPYMPIPFSSERLPELIKGILIGPTNKLDLANLGLIEYLKHRGFDSLLPTISHSSIPLRF